MWTRVKYRKFDVLAGVVSIDERCTWVEIDSDLDSELATDPSGFRRGSDDVGNSDGSGFDSFDEVAIDAIHEVMHQVARDFVADVGDEYGESVSPYSEGSPRYK